MKIFDTLNRLNACFGPAGQEEGISAELIELAKPFVDEVSIDTMGNLICHKKGSGKRIMIAAHMDSIGIIAVHIEKGGEVRFAGVGGLSPIKILGAPVRFENGTQGTIAANEDADMTKLTFSDLYVDLGAVSDKEAEKYVRVGDMAVFNTPCVQTAFGSIISPYTDNRSCCVAMLLAMEEYAEKAEKECNDLWFVFTVQEEVGLRGAKPSAFAIDPEYAIACDVTVSNDNPKAKNFGSSVMGKGAAIKVMDRSVICHPQVVDLLEKLAKKNRIAYQRDVITAGGTDAGAIHVSRGGVLSGGVSVPCRLVHSPQELVSEADIEATGKLLAAFALNKF